MLYIGLLMSMFLDYVRPGSYLPIINAFKLNSLIPLLVLAATIFDAKSTSNQRVFSHTNTKLLIFFMFLLGVSILTADVTFYSYNIFINVLGFIFWFYMIVRLINTKERIQGIFVVFIVSHVIVLLLNPQVVLNPETRSYITGNPFLGDGNDFALSIVSLALPMCIYMVLTSTKLVYRVIFLILLLVLIFAVIGTQSRGASIALASLLLYLWWAGRHKVMGVIVLGVIVTTILSYAPSIYFQRMNTVANYQNEGSAQGRIRAWKTAIRMVKKYPITGVGSGHFAVRYGTEFKPPEYDGLNMPWKTAHSMYFLIIGELGIPGISCILLLLFGTYSRNSRIIREARGSPDPDIQSYANLFLALNASLIGFAVSSAFLSVAYYPHLYVLIGIYTAASFIFEDSMSNSTGPKKAVTKQWYDDNPANIKWSDSNENNKFS